MPVTILRAVGFGVVDGRYTLNALREIVLFYLLNGEWQ